MSENSPYFQHAQKGPLPDHRGEAINRAAEKDWLELIHEREMELDQDQTAKRNRMDVKTLANWATAMKAAGVPDEIIRDFPAEFFYTDGDPDQVNDEPESFVQWQVANPDAMKSISHIKGDNDNKSPESEKLNIQFEVGQAEEQLHGEDSMLRDDKSGLFGVFDGAGGGGGNPEAASRAANEGIAEYFQTEDGSRIPNTEDEAVKIMREAFKHARLKTESEGQGGYTTATVMKLYEIDGNKLAVVGNSGDTRLTLRKADGRIIATEDQCSANVLHNCFGRPERKGRKDAFYLIEIAEGDSLVIASDGIWGDWESQLLSNDELEDAFTSGNSQEIAERFIELSKKSDDKSIIALKFFVDGNDPDAVIDPIVDQSDDNQATGEPPAPDQDTKRRSAQISGGANPEQQPKPPEKKLSWKEWVKDRWNREGAVTFNKEDPSRGIKIGQAVVDTSREGWLDIDKKMVAVGVGTLAAGLVATYAARYGWMNPLEFLSNSDVNVPADSAVNTTETDVNNVPNPSDSSAGTPAEITTEEPNKDNSPTESMPEPDRSKATEYRFASEKLNIPQGLGIEDSLQNQYSLSDQEAREAFERMRQYLEGANGTYMVDGDIRISESGSFSLPEDAQRELDNYLKERKKLG